MAQRRMFSPDIVGSDAFMEMPTSSQVLYFHLGMRADDDGFVSPQIPMRMVGANQDDLKILIAKGFLIPFENGVVVLKHWRMNNFIRKDRYKATNYIEQKATLRVKENMAYTLDGNQGEPIAQVEWKSDAQVRLSSGQPVVNAGKVRLGKVRLGKKETLALAPALPSFIEKEMWSEWEQYRKEKRQALKPTTIARQLKFLGEHPSDANKIIEQSIRNGWTGLFPLKSGFAGSKPINVITTEHTKTLSDRMKEKADKNN